MQTWRSFSSATAATPSPMANGRMLKGHGSATPLDQLRRAPHCQGVPRRSFARLMAGGPDECSLSVKPRRNKMRLHACHVNSTTAAEFCIMYKWIKRSTGLRRATCRPPVCHRTKEEQGENTAMMMAMLIMIVMLLLTSSLSLSMLLLLPSFL